MKRFLALLALLIVVGCTLPDFDVSSRSKAPFPSPEGLSVLLISKPDSDSQDKLTANQEVILSPNGAVYQWCLANCVKAKNGVPECRIASPDNPMTRESVKWQTAIKAERPDLPCILAVNKSKVFVAAVGPNAKPEEVIARLQKVK